MLKANEVTPARMKNIVPEMCKGRVYTELVEGMGINITGIAINVYPAKGEDGDELYPRDEKLIVRRVAYFNIGEMAYSSVKGYTAVEQLISCAPDLLDHEEPGTYEAPIIGSIPVVTITVKEKMGKKEYDYLAFDPQA